MLSLEKTVIRGSPASAMFSVAVVVKAVGQLSSKQNWLKMEAVPFFCTNHVLMETVWF